MTTRAKLEAIGIINTHDLLKRFAPDKKLAVACSFNGYVSREMRSAGTKVWSPFFKTAPGKSRWQDGGNMKFTGDRTPSMAEAMAWASKTYGIDEWATCPTDSYTRVPKVVRERALAAIRGVQASKLKVYRWIGHRHECPPAPNGGKQTHEVCAAPSKAAAARAAGVDRPAQLGNNLGETHNAADMAQALSEPGVIFWRPLVNTNSEWRRG